MRIPRIPSLKRPKAKGDEEPKTVQTCQEVQKDEGAAEKCKPETNDSMIAATETNDDDISSSCSPIAASIASIASSVLTAVYNYDGNDNWCGVGTLIQNDHGDEGTDCEECRKPILWNEKRMVLEIKDTKMYFHVPCFDYTQAAIKSQLRSGKYDRPQQLDAIMMMTATPTPTLTQTHMTSQDCKRGGTFSKLHQKFHLIKNCRAWNAKIHKIPPYKENNNTKATTILNRQPSFSHSAKSVPSIKQTKQQVIVNEKEQMQSKENEKENQNEEEKEKENVTNSVCGPFGNSMFGCIPSQKVSVLEMTNSGFSRIANDMFGLASSQKDNVPEVTNSGSGPFANQAALPVIELSNGVMILYATTK